MNIYIIITSPTSLELLSFRIMVVTYQHPLSSITSPKSEIKCCQKKRIMHTDIWGYPS